VCWQSPDTYRNLDLAGAIAFPGLTLPDLAAGLRNVNDPTAHHWPHDARLLRALVGPGETEAGPALTRYAQLPGYNPSPAGLDRVTGHDAIHRKMLQLLSLEPPGESLIAIDAHIAQVARYIDGFFGIRPVVPLRHPVGGSSPAPGLLAAALRRSLGPIPSVKASQQCCFPFGQRKTWSELQFIAISQSQRPPRSSGQADSSVHSTSLFIGPRSGESDGVVTSFDCAAGHDEVRPVHRCVPRINWQSSSRCAFSV
jgi:hypothetical protein